MVMGQADAAIAEHATQLSPPPSYVAGVWRDTLIPLSALTSRTQGIQARPTKSSANSALKSQASGTPILTSVRNRTQGSEPLTGRANNTIDAAPSPMPMAGTFDRSAISPASTAHNASSTRQGADRADTVRSRQSAEPTEVAGRIDHHFGSNRALGSPSGLAATEGSSSALGRRLLGDSHSANIGGSDTPGPVNGSHLGQPDVGRANGENMFGSSIGTDAAPPSAGQPNRMSVGAGGGEPIPYAGMLTAGSSAPGVGATTRRDDGRGIAEWAMPIGGRPVIEPAPEIVVRHDPGPGVIGIDR